MKTIFLLRHCSTKDSELHINGSQTNTPLSEKGLKQAQELISTISEFQYDVIIVSPLQRTLQTIQPYLESLDTQPEVIVEPLTIERDLGGLTNTVAGDGKIPASIRASGKDKIEWTPPGGESFTDVYKRAQIVFKKIKNLKKSSILISGHQGFLRCLELVILKKEMNEVTYNSAPRMELGEIRKYII